MMRELGVEPDAAAVVAHYGSLVDRWVIDCRDASLVPQIESLGKPVAVTETLMSDATRSEALARVVLAATGALDH